MYKQFSNKLSQSEFSEEALLLIIFDLSYD